MPFRERLRKTFSRNSSSGNSDTSSLSKTNTNGTTLDYRTNPNVYKPGEKMPPLKYRRPVAKEHKEHLEAFSFAKAWRRRSHQSMYSPMGSRMPSRAGSVTTGPSRNGSVTTAGTAGMRKSFQRGGSLELPPDGLEEGKEDASDVANGALRSSLESWSF
ncbi:hypothetical protein NA57DRAFT_51005 [Rhizodiscina lignyota]|uniref:Uncharacterized protein n=1 Tax=Rhizodiscina lignyota TaxID=1504668 RepID=A0A9P4IRQ0_9PEZI|nr:hypothetical protein NA57DRAFT_51005 [Rhizodiscina lignyota]